MISKFRIPILLLICNSIFITILSSQGRVGINTINPMAALHVSDSSVVFTGAFNNLPTNPPPPPLEGTGHRFMWYAPKSAMRIGKAFGTSWNKDSIGNYSFAFGNNPKAVGVNSIAFGENAIARGNNSIALGKNTFASHESSLAIGSSAQAKAINAIALGIGNQATGTEALSMGRGNISSGQNSTSFGFFTKAMGKTSFSAGKNTEAIGELSVAFGENTKSHSYNCFTIGRNNESFPSSSQVAWFADDPIFIIGNGSSPASPSNALVINKAGQMGINLGTALPQAMLHLKALNNDTDMHIRLEHNSNGNYASIYFDDHFNFKMSNPIGEYRWKDSIGNILMKLNSEGKLTTTNLAEFGGLAFTPPNTITVIQDNQLIAVSTTSYMRLLSDSAVETNRTIRLTNGQTIGQLLIIECAEASASIDGFELSDNVGTSNTNIASNIIMNTGDVVQFVWNGEDWILVAHSDN